MSRYTTVHADDVVTFGATQPVLTVLDVGGFEVRDLFLLGASADCGQIIVGSESRALNIEAVLEPAYAVTVRQLTCGDWAADYSRRDRDGGEPDRFITGITLKDGTVAMKDGYLTRGGEADGRA